MLFMTFKNFVKKSLIGGRRNESGLHLRLIKVQRSESEFFW